MTPLSPIRIAIGEPFAFSFTVTGQDWTGYTGSVLFKRRPADEDALLEVAATGASNGVVTFALTAADTLNLPALDRRGFYAQGVYQVRLTNGSDVQTYQHDFGTAAAL